MPMVVTNFLISNKFRSQRSQKSVKVKEGKWSKKIVEEVEKINGAYMDKKQVVGWVVNHKKL